MTTDNDLKNLRKEIKTVKKDVSDIKKRMKNMATKDDIKNMATKDDLKNLVTKQEAKNFATKDDIKNLASDIGIVIDMMGEVLEKSKEHTNILENHEKQLDRINDKLFA